MSRTWQYKTPHMRDFRRMRYDSNMETLFKNQMKSAAAMNENAIQMGEPPRWVMVTNASTAHVQVVKMSAANAEGNLSSLSSGKYRSRYDMTMEQREQYDLENSLRVHPGWTLGSDGLFGEHHDYGGRDHDIHWDGGASSWFKQAAKLLVGRQNIQNTTKNLQMLISALTGSGALEVKTRKSSYNHGWVSEMTYKGYRISIREEKEDE